MDHQLRRTTLADGLGDLGIDALFVTRLPNVRYLTGFTGSNGQALVTGSGSVLFTDGRYTEQARHEVPDLERVTYASSATTDLRASCDHLRVTTLGFEAHDVSVAAHERLAGAMDGVELTPTQDVVERRRWIKDPEELAALREAQRVTDLAFDDIVEWLAVGQTERQLAYQLELVMRREGADGMAFDPIVAFGENAAEPHHEPGHRVLEEGDVVKLDIGALWEGYHADMTRTIAFGEPAPELKKVHEVVKEAQQAGIDAVHAGVTGAQVDAAAREVIAASGYGDRFSHGLGHGVGLEIHEGPRLGREFDHVLPTGSVVTVEPGIYLPGLGGVRIEDMVEVTDDGCRVLGVSSRDLIEL